MKQVLAVLALLIPAFACGAQPAQPAPPAKPPTEAFSELVAESTAYLKARMARAQEEFKLGNYERFDYNQTAATLTWSDAGVPKVIAKIQFAGSTSFQSKTWLWSWANPSILEIAKSDIHTVKEFGQRMKYPRLTEAKWPAEEVDGWEVTAIAASLLKAKGAYRAPDSRGYAFMIFTEIRWAK